MGGLLHLVQQGEDWAGPQPIQAPPHCSKWTVHPSVASVPVITSLYNSPLLCSFNVPMKGLKGLEWVFQACAYPDCQPLVSVYRNQIVETLF